MNLKDVFAAHSCGGSKGARGTPPPGDQILSILGKYGEIVC